MTVTNWSSLVFFFFFFVLTIWQCITALQLSINTWLTSAQTVGPVKANGRFAAALLKQRASAGPDKDYGSTPLKWASRKGSENENQMTEVTATGSLGAKVDIGMS
jgi:hypothetical protein